MRLLLPIVGFVSGTVVEDEDFLGDCSLLRRYELQVTRLTRSGEDPELLERVTRTLEKYLKACKNVQEANRYRENIIQEGNRDGRIGWHEMPMNPPEEKQAVQLDGHDLSQFGPRMREMRRVQQILDEAAPAWAGPFLFYDSEILPSGEHIALDRRAIVLKSDTSVFWTKNWDRVIKYQVSCDTKRKPIMALEKEYWILKYIEPLRIAPRAYVLSSPGQLPHFRTPKTDFTMSDGAYQRCADALEVKVRYLVTQQIAWTISDYVNFDHFRSQPARDRLELLVGWIQLLIASLEKLHDEGVVHGDIHPGNVGDFFEQNQVALIDFGQAFFESDELFLNRDTVNYKSHCLLTHWNLKGARKGFRDDVYRALLSLAFAVVPGTYDRCRRLAESESTRAELIAFHEHEFWFDPILQDAYGESDEGVTVRQLLQEALRVARSVADVRARPDYYTIRRNLTQIYATIEEY